MIQDNLALALDGTMVIVGVIAFICLSPILIPGWIIGKLLVKFG